MKFLSIVICLLAVFSSCTNSTKNGKEKSFDSGAVFYDYKIWGEEENDSVTILLKYRMGNQEGPMMSPDSGTKVMLDNTELEADSAKLAGVYYETMLPVEKFIGRHSVVFTDINGNEHRQQFSFTPFSLAAELPTQIKKEPFVIRLTGFGNERKPVRLIMIDTAFGTADVNEELDIKNGELIITSKMWRALKSGPIVLEIYLEEETPLIQGAKEVGVLSLTYVLKREFEAIEK